MPIITRADFATICKTTVGVINVNVSRKKISTLSTNKTMVDTENPLNKIFKKKQLALAAEKLAGERAEKKGKVYEKAKEKSDFRKVIDAAVPEEDEDLIDEIYSKEETETEKKARIKQNERDEDVSDWDLKKKKFDALKSERDAELKYLQIQKLNGELMPVDLVESIIKLNIKHINKNFEQDLINLASVYCDVLAGGNREKLAELISKMRQKLNHTIKRTETTALQEIENVVEDYAESRNRGERK